MRRNGLRVGLLAGALGAASCMQNMAADTGAYVNIDAGVNIVSDVDFDIGIGTATAELAPGFRGSVAGGYRFTPMLAAEVETGFLMNEVDQISFGGSSGDVDDVSLSHVPLLANVVFRFENDSPFIPFVGAGAGGVASFLNLDDDDLGSDDNDSDLVFAWQLQAGVHYRINDQMSVGLAYKYLGTDSPEFDIEGETIELDSVHNHSILGSFNWSF